MGKRSFWDYARRTVSASIAREIGCNMENMVEKRNPPASFGGKSLLRWQRWALGLLGLALTVPGLAGVFMPGTNVGGVPLLIAAGAVLLYIAVSGQQVLAIGADAVALSPLQIKRMFVQQVVDDVRNQPLSLVRDAVGSARGDGLAVDIPPEVDQTLLAYERLDRLGRRHGFRVDQPDRPEQQGADLLITRLDGGRLPVEVKFHHAASGPVVHSAIRQAESIGAKEALIILNSEPPEGLLPAGVEVVNGTVDRDAFEAAATGALVRLGVIRDDVRPVAVNARPSRP